MAEMKFTTNPSGTKKADGKKTGLFVGIGVIVVVLLIVLFNSFSVVNEGYIGVKYQFGKIVEDNLSAGLNMCIPFIEEIQQVDTREQVYAVTANAYTSDTQTVNELQLKLNYYYDKSKLSTLIREVGISNVESKLVVPNVAKITKNEIGKVKAEVLVQSRAEVQQSIQDEITETLNNSGIIVTAFALENLSFDSAFEESIQAKVIAAQDALKMENKTKEKEEEAKQVVIKAQADADSTKIAAEAQAQAIKLIQEQLASSPNYVEYLKVSNWDGKLPTAMGTEINPFVVLGNQDSTTGTTSKDTTSKSE